MHGPETKIETEVTVAYVEVWWENLFVNLHLQNKDKAGSLQNREDGRWMQVDQDRVQWRAFVLAVLYLWT
jgi:hypothetical protein